MKFFQPPAVKIIVQSQDELSDKQMDEVFRVSDQTMWWRALLQLIERHRAISTAQAAASAGGNNPLAMAANIGAHTALTALLDDLTDRQTKPTSS
jgi:hypothetical protein